MMHPDAVEQMKAPEDRMTAPDGPRPNAEARTCLYHRDVKHQHPLCPPMGTRGAMVQSWFCCHCGVVGQHVTISDKANVGLLGAVLDASHGPLMEVVRQGTVVDAKKGRRT